MSTVLTSEQKAKITQGNSFVRKTRCACNFSRIVYDKIEQYIVKYKNDNFNRNVDAINELYNNCSKLVNTTHELEVFICDGIDKKYECGASKVKNGL